MTPKIWRSADYLQQAYNGIYMIYDFARSRKLALRGEIYKKPLICAVFIGLLLSYISSFMYAWFPSAAFNRQLSEFGLFTFGIVVHVSSLSKRPDWCAYVMTVGCAMLPLYMVFLFTSYFPFSKYFKVAVRVQSRKNITIFKKRKKVLPFLFVFLLVYLLGDMKVISFPTMLNGGLLSGESSLLVCLANSSFLLPFFAWFVAFFSAVVCWSFFNIMSGYFAIKG